MVQFLVAQLQCLDMLQEIHRACPADKLGWSALRWACITGNDECITALLQDLDDEDVMRELVLLQDGERFSPLHVTCSERHPACIKAILKVRDKVKIPST